ncbi:MAG: LemA family protein [Candidatus Omnitrophica bacterium]|nr:LemA family protein [Candidatus Omnitrophota bacterium]
MLIALIIIGVFGLIFFGMYNGLVGKKNQVENAFSGVDVMLKKRYDLIPNLVSAVKQYMQHEKNTLTEITELRSKAVSGSLSNDEKVEIDNRISKAIGGIMVAVENYPDLKASANFLNLQRSLNEIEEQISAARRSYNASVLDYNNAVEMVPTNFIAGLMNYQRKMMFEIIDAERKNVQVGDLFKN